MPKGAQGEGDQTIRLYLAHVGRTECYIPLTPTLSLAGEGVAIAGEGQDGGPRLAGIAAAVSRLARVALLGALAGCTAASHGDPYRVTVDLAPSIQALGSDNLFASAPAADEIAALGPAALPALEVALQREAPAVRLGVVVVLEQLGADGVALLVRSARDDASPEVRQEAVVALGRVGDASATAVVEAALHDADPQMQRAALVACARLCRSPDAMQTLIDAALRGAAIVPARHSVLLIALGDDPQRAAPARQAIEVAVRPQLRAAALDDRFNAALIIAALGDPTAVPILREAMQGGTDPQRQTQAVLALALVYDPSAVEAARSAVAGSDPVLRLAACQVLHALAEHEVEGARDALTTCPATARDPAQGAP